MFLDDSPGTVDYLTIWRDIRTQVEMSASKIELKRSCNWVTLRKARIDALRGSLVQSGEYAAFFLRALLGDELRELHWDRTGLVVSDTQALSRLRKATEEDLLGADLVARLALTVAWKICQSSGCNLYPSLDHIEHPDSRAPLGDGCQCQLCFVSADFIEGRTLGGPQYLFIREDGAVEKGTFTEHNRIYYKYELEPGKKDSIRNHGWRTGIEKTFANNPYGRDGERDEKSVESFLGFPAFFQHDFLKSVFSCPDGGFWERLALDSESLTENDKSVDDFIELGLKPYFKAKQDEFQARNSVSSVHGSLVLCLGIPHQHAAYFDPKQLQTAYGVFLTVDIKTNGSNLHRCEISLNDARCDLQELRYQLQYKVLQLLTAKLIRETSAHKAQLERLYENEKLQGRILAQIQKPFQGIVQSLFGAQAMTQQINAVLFAPHVSLFAVAPMVQRYFIPGQDVSFGKVSWLSIHNCVSGELSLIRNTICAVVLTALGVSGEVIETEQDLWWKAMSELGLLAKFEEISAEVPPTQRKAWRRLDAPRDVGPRDKIIILCRQLVGNLFENEEKQLRSAFRRFKEVVFIPFKPEAADWPLLPLLILASQKSRSVQATIVIDKSSRFTITSVESFLREEDARSSDNTLEGCRGNERSSIPDLLLPLRKGSESFRPSLPVAAYNHLLEFVLGVMDVLDAGDVEVYLELLSGTSRIRLLNVTKSLLDQVGVILKKMKHIVDNKFGAGLRGDLESPFLIFAERSANGTKQDGCYFANGDQNELVLRAEGSCCISVLIGQHANAPFLEVCLSDGR